MRRLGRLGENERTMLLARQTYDTMIRGSEPLFPVSWYCRSLYGSRYTLFVRAYYRIWVSALARPSPKHKSYLTKNDLEHEGITLVVAWLSGHYKSPRIMLCVVPHRAISNFVWEYRLGQIIEDHVALSGKTNNSHDPSAFLRLVEEWLPKRVTTYDAMCSTTSHDLRYFMGIWFGPHRTMLLLGNDS